MLYSKSNDQRFHLVNVLAVNVAWGCISADSELVYKWFRTVETFILSFIPDRSAAKLSCASPEHLGEASGVCAS